MFRKERKERFAALLISLAAAAAVLAGCGSNSATLDAAPGVTPPARAPVARMAPPPAGHVSGAMRAGSQLKAMAAAGRR